LARGINPFDAVWFLQCRKCGENAYKNGKIATFFADFDGERFAVAKINR
jgi:hypothetical protein